MTSDRTTVFVVDDHPSVRTSMERLIRSVGWKVETFASTEAFLKRLPLDGTCCLLLDVHMPGTSGTEFLDMVCARDWNLPIVFLTGQGERAARRSSVQSHLDSLSPRERQVMDGVLSGRLNKQIAGDMEISEKTVKVHRARVMEQMGVGSVAELVGLCGTDIVDRAASAKRRGGGAEAG
ncbi:response regulator transcription factor [Variovorax saccharolyticus]|uniref:response regulator transcription factor n=1 Tax=Variovorax saccharolyticus TaxID=3053516 RepID=UPI0025754B00|nr:LuxR C-terminal-related transcriptional regulator [Variovorax sp. J31P216]MDM0029637.1 LuxR C-terminal-related transcriptional regulator [Variovorax sp. J31P216]